MRRGIIPHFASLFSVDLGWFSISHIFNLKIGSRSLKIELVESMRCLL
jgi:hypothetical protein